jgi:hypothetical protein
MGREPEIGRTEREPSLESPQFDREAHGDRDSRARRQVRMGRQIYSLNPEERQSLYDMGRFRVLAGPDVLALRYHGRPAQMRQDLRSLIAQGLAQHKSVWTGKNKEVDEFWALTKAGKRFLKRQFPVPAGQALYTGFVKPKELRHDAAVYPVFQREAAQIERDGGSVRRVVLDYELKKKAYSPLAKARALLPEEYAKRQAEIADQYRLKVVNGHLVLPDLRIEYVDAHGLAAYVDLEVATENYHGSHAAEKAAAGFRIYASSETAGRLSRALEEREISAEIFAL